MARRTLPIVTSAASECALRTEGEKMAACETEYHTEVHTGEAQYETWRELREIREITATDRSIDLSRERGSDRSFDRSFERERERKRERERNNGGESLSVCVCVCVCVCV